MRCVTTRVQAVNVHNASSTLLQYKWSGRRGVHACIAGAAIPLRPGGLHAGLTCGSYMSTIGRNTQNGLMLTLCDPRRTSTLPRVDATSNMYGKMASGVRRDLRSDCSVPAWKILRIEMIKRYAILHVTWCCIEKGTEGWNWASQHVKLTHLGEI